MKNDFLMKIENNCFFNLSNIKLLIKNISYATKLIELKENSTIIFKVIELINNKLFYIFLIIKGYRNKFS